LAPLALDILKQIASYDYYTDFVLFVQMTCLMYLVVQGHKIEPFKSKLDVEP